ncbi:MAG: (2Fe-2S)-binding protein, partial [Spirochaetales bacterium]|nr:(2Fe-2S)-binding protein [Spirochaetales bacterium]
MFTITVNNKKVAADHGETILTVLKREKIDIPTLCHLEGLTPTGSCRICIVELADSGRLIPGCSSEVYENMAILTHSPTVIEARKTILSLLLANHPDDCLYCVKQGNCELSRLAQIYGVRERLTTHSHKYTRLDVSGTSIVRDNSKCILCGKCIRVCEEIQTVSAIDFVSRGHTTEVACVFKNNINISSCINCGQCINVCPTGALYEKSHIEQTIDALRDP